MPIVQLTPAFLASLTCPPPASSIEYCCSTVPGLYVRVTASKPGEGIYYLRYKGTDKKTKHERFGRTGEIALDEARNLAKKFKAEVALGLHAAPAAVNPGKGAPPTLQDFYERKFLPHVKQRKRSWRRDKELFELRLLPRFGQQRIDQIGRHEVQVFHGGLKASGLSPATADHHLKVLRFALNLAVEWELIDRNPIAGIKLFNEDNRVENILTDEQLARLLDVLDQDPNRPVCLIAQFLLCTGARLNEALSARWENVDLGKRHWLIPAKNSKSKKPRAVPLNDSAIQVLMQLDTRAAGSHVFINRQTGKPYTTIMKVWERLRGKAGLPHLRVHDLRHTFASLLVNSGRTLYEVQQILGHTTSKVTERYSHLSSETLRNAASMASVLKPVPRLAAMSG